MNNPLWKAVVLVGMVGLACKSSGSTDVRPSAAPPPATHEARPVVAAQPTSTSSAAATAPKQAVPPSSTRSTMNAPMHLLYTRSGGFAGFNDEVQVTGDDLKVTRRGKVVTERKLTAEELQKLQALAEKAKDEPLPAEAAPKRPTPDALQVSVSIGALRADVKNPPQHLGPAWQELAEAMQGLINPVK